MGIEENVRAVLEGCAAAAVKSGRRPEDVAVLAATKMNDKDRIQVAIGAGIRLCGENRCQELTEKLSQGAYAGAQLHYIGHLQKNKLNKLVGVCSLIQSVDSPALLDAVSKRALAVGCVQDVLIEVNIGREENKSGVLPEALDELLAQSAVFKGAHILGLMGIPPKPDNGSRKYNYFDELCKIYVDMGAKKYDNTNMCVLSMGMSADYESAILSGANLVRVGTAIFGQRHY